MSKERNLSEGFTAKVVDGAGDLKELFLMKLKRRFAPFQKAEPKLAKKLCQNLLR